MRYCYVDRCALPLCRVFLQYFSMDSNNLIFALILTLFAGLSTGVGSLIAFFARKTNRSLLAFSLGLSAGVMVYVSFVELFAHSQSLLIEEYGERQGVIYAVLSLFAGIALIAIADLLIPSSENPHELRCVEDMDSDTQGKQLKRMGVFTAVAIALHNFPEGIATFLTAYEDPSLGIAVAVAVAIHNIPEGIAVAIPIYYATGDRRKSFWYSSLSGLAEPLGGLMAYLLLAPYMSATMMSVVLSGVAGVMIYISVDELLPSAREYGRAHHSIVGFMVGMAIMAFSLILLI